jgi:hypothetical protein
MPELTRLQAARVERLALEHGGAVEVRTIAHHPTPGALGVEVRALDGSGSARLDEWGRGQWRRHRNAPAGS